MRATEFHLLSYFLNGGQSTIVQTTTMTMTIEGHVPRPAPDIAEIDLPTCANLPRRWRHDRAD